MGLGSLFGRGGARAGVVGVDDLTAVASKLVQAGFEPKDIPKILPLIIGGGVGAAGIGAAAAGGLGSKLAGGGASLIGTLGTEVGAEAIANKLFGSRVPITSAETAGKGFLTTTPEQLAYEQAIYDENFRRSLLNLIPGVKLEKLEPLELLDIASARKERELEGATKRQIQSIEAQRKFDVQIAELERQAQIEKQRLASEAQVAAQREQSLGDIQRQRVESSYATASDLLSQTIKDVLARERYENNTALAGLAQAI